MNIPSGYKKIGAETIFCQCNRSSVTLTFLEPEATMYDTNGGAYTAFMKGTAYFVCNECLDCMYYIKEKLLI